MPPAHPLRGRLALGMVTVFVALLAVSGLALVVGASDAGGRAFGAVELVMGLLILGLLVPVWRGPRGPQGPQAPQDAPDPPDAPGPRPPEPDPPA